MMEQSHLDHVTSGVEALLFVSDKPVLLDQLKQIFPGFTVVDFQQIIQGLTDEYQKRNGGMMIVEIAGGYQMLSSSHCASYIRSFYKTTHKEKYPSRLWKHWRSSLTNSRLAEAMSRKFAALIPTVL